MSNFGIGFGIDYGGIGARGTYFPVSRLGLFAAAGYNFDALGWNVGAQWLIPAKKNYFYFTGMYGYNAVLVVEGTINDKGTYYGVSGGIGYQIMSSNGSRHWNLELLLPIRSKNFQHDIDALRIMGAKVSDPLPVAFSIGYHFK